MMIISDKSDDHAHHRLSGELGQGDNRVLSRCRTRADEGSCWFSHRFITEAEIELDDLRMQRPKLLRHTVPFQRARGRKRSGIAVVRRGQGLKVVHGM